MQVRKNSNKINTICWWNYRVLFNLYILTMLSVFSTINVITANMVLKAFTINVIMHNDDTSRLSVYKQTVFVLCVQFICSRTKLLRSGQGSANITYSNILISGRSTNLFETFVYCARVHCYFYLLQLWFFFSALLYTYSLMTHYCDVTLPIMFNWLQICEVCTKTVKTHTFGHYDP